VEEMGLVIPEKDWRKLLAAASGDCALLYLYLRAGGSMDQAACALRLTDSRMDCAAALLKQMGLWQEPTKVLRPAQPPVYTEADLVREMERKSDFPELVGEAQRRLGKVLSTEELKVLLSIYDYLGFPLEVVSMLLAYCIHRSRTRSGRMPSMHAIEKEAYRWADRGIETMEEAAAYMQMQAERAGRVGALRQVLQLGERKLTRGEEQYLLQWLDWGFGEEAVTMAYEKTCLNTGGLKWPYLNSILKSWHEQGLHTAAEIHSGDKAPGKPERNAPAQPSQRARDAVARMMQEQGG